MPDISELKKSSFVTKGDLGANGSLFTITGVEQVNVAKDGAPPEMKWALNFQEIDKPFVLNSTNGQIIAKFTGTTKMEAWGQTRAKVVLFFDPNVSYAGQLMGGIRARAPRVAGTGGATAPTAPTPSSAAINAAPDGPDSDIPF